MDFEAGTLTIRHIVTSTNLEGKHVLVEADRAKTKSSLRTLPLVAKRVGLDPAIMATPLISTLVDISTISVYFAIVSYVFHL